MPVTQQDCHWRSECPPFQRKIRSRGIGITAWLHSVLHPDSLSERGAVDFWLVSNNLKRVERDPYGVSNSRCQSVCSCSASTVPGRASEGFRSLASQDCDHCPGRRGDLPRQRHGPRVSSVPDFRAGRGSFRSEKASKCCDNALANF